MLIIDDGPVKVTRAETVMSTEFTIREGLIQRSLSKLSTQQATEYCDILRYTLHNICETATAERLARLESHHLVSYLDAVRQELAVVY